MPNPNTPGEDNRQPTPPGNGRNRNAADGNREDTYFEKLLKYVPGDIVAAFVALDGIIRDQIIPHNLYLQWGVFVGLLILAPLYAVYRPSSPPPPSLQAKRTFHAVAALVAFTVWVFALGGPFAATWPDIYRPVYGTVLLIFTTLVIPLFEKVILGRE
jgi:hypothetical protein